MFRQNRVDEDQLPDMRQSDFWARIRPNAPQMLRMVGSDRKRSTG